MIEARIDSAEAQKTLAQRRGALRRRLGARFADGAQALIARVRAKLSGDVLVPRTGALRASLRTAVAEDGRGFEARVWSDGSVPYARIQEYGGRIAVPDIRAVDAGALAFMYGGRLVFAERARAHVVTIPPRNYMRTSLAEFAPAFIQSIAQIAGDR